MKPVILLTHRPNRSVQPFGPDYGIHSNYATPLIAAGAVPLITAGGDPAEMARIADGILFTGGTDVDPRAYGEENLYSQAPVPGLDRMEIDLFHVFFQAGKPVFGICRGIQLANVALGGTLYQDIPSQMPAPQTAAPSPGETDRHPVDAVKGSVVETLFGGRFLVNSFHHQGVKKVGRGLVVAARNAEGVIEAGISA